MYRAPVAGRAETNSSSSFLPLLCSRLLYRELPPRFSLASSPQCRGRGHEPQMNADRQGTARQQRHWLAAPQAPSSAPAACLFLGICGYCSKKEEKSFQRKITGYTGRNLLRASRLSLCVTAPGTCASREQGCSSMRLALPVLPRRRERGRTQSAACPPSPSPSGNRRALSPDAVGASFHESLSPTIRWVCLQRPQQ